MVELKAVSDQKYSYYARYKFMEVLYSYFLTSRKDDNTLREALKAISAKAKREGQELNPNELFE